MPSLKTSFDELVERIRQGRELGHASYEPIYYLVFHPHEIIEVKRLLPTWLARLRNEGWEPQTLSMAAIITEIIEQSPLLKIWQTADAKAPLAWDKTNKSIANALTKGDVQNRVAQLLTSLKGKKKAVVLLTDLEALHPYLRPGVIEGQLYGKFYAPTVFLYPGERTGKTRLKFLGFYHEDGNYRSVHIGG